MSLFLLIVFSMNYSILQELISSSLTSEQLRSKRGQSLLRRQKRFVSDLGDHFTFLNVYDMILLFIIFHVLYVINLFMLPIIFFVLYSSINQLFIYMYFS